METVSYFHQIQDVMKNEMYPISTSCWDVSHIPARFAASFVSSFLSLFFTDFCYFHYWNKLFQNVSDLLFAIGLLKYLRTTHIFIPYVIFFALNGSRQKATILLSNTTDK